MLLSEMARQRRLSGTARHGMGRDRSRRRRQVALECLEARLCLSQFTDVWGGGVGNYSDAAKWNLGVVPNNGIEFDGTLATFTVDIANGPDSAVTLDMSPTIDNLTVDATNSLTIADNEQLTVLASTGPGSTTGSIDNAGTIALDSGGTNYTNLVISGAGGNVTLTGGGVVALDNSTLDQIFGATGSETLTNVNNTIEGGGEVGNNNLPYGELTLINQGTIDANLSTPLTIDPNSGGVTNTGTLEATGGGTLTLYGFGSLVPSGAATFANAGGTILSTGAGSVVNVTANATITGGTLTTASGGVMQNSGFISNATLSGVTISADSTFSEADGSVTTLVGTITNQGTIALNSSGNNNADLVISGSVSLTGGGTVALGNSTYNVIFGATASPTGPETLTNVNNTIEGGGTLGDGELALINQGTIDANLSTPLTIEPSAGGVTNTGVLEATAGGTLTLYGNPYTGGSTFAIAGTTILSQGASSVVNVTSDATITAGTLTTTSGGVMQNPGSNATLSGVTISADSTFSEADGSITTLVGTITNQGTIALNSSGNNNADLVISGSVSLTGGGTVALGNSTYNVIFGATASPTGPETLTNVNNTIEGGGTLGDGELAFINQGTIDANLSTPLTIEPSAGGVTNTGVLEATAGGTLTLYGNPYTGGSTFAIAGTTILSTGSGSVVNVTSDATITAGTLTTTSGGIMQNPGNNVTLSGVTVGMGSTFTGQDNSITTLEGTITNQGTIALNAVGNGTNLVISGNVNLTGGGTVALGNNTLDRILGATGSATLTNVNNTIEGGGTLGDGELALINQGTINANHSTPLTIEPSAGGVTNTGTLEATAGGTLTLYGNPYTSGSTFTNTDGTIQSTGTDSVVNLTSNATINGGTLTTASGDIMQNPGNNVTLGGVTVGMGSTFTGQDNSITTLEGTITNQGTIALNAVGNGTNLVISGNVNLTGGGTVALGNNTLDRILGSTGSATLTNVDNTIEGGGTLGDGYLAVFDNQGTVLASQSTPLTVNVTSITNEGTYQVNGGSTLAVTGPNGFTQNAGLTTVATNGNFTVNDNYNEAGGTVTINVGGALSASAFSQTAGITTVDGTLNASPVNIAGTLFGNGTVTGAVSNTGTVVPGDSPTPGQLNVTGDYAQNSGAVLDIAVGGTAPGVGGFNVLNASGGVTLGTGSILNVSLVNGFIPTDGETFQFLNYASQTGTFTTLNGPQQRYVTFTLAYFPTFAVLTAHVASPPTSTVSPLPATTNTTSFTVSWSGTPGPGATSIASYTIYDSEDGGPFTAFLTNTTSTSATFTGQFGHSYGFYSVATDNLGDVQPAPSAAQATTYLAGLPTSTVSSLPAVTTSTTITLRWTGNPGPGAASIASYEIFVSEDGGAFEPLTASTTATSAAFTGQYGHTYAFYSVATDNRGDVQPTPSAAQATTYLAGLPTGAVKPLPATTTTTSFTVSWSGTPGPGATTIASYTIYDSQDGGPFTAFLSNTTATSATFTGELGHSYGFYSVATDNLGDVQPTPSAAEATTDLAGLPTSSVNALPAVTASSSFTVGWAGTAGAGATNIASYEIFVSVDGGAFQPFLTGTTATSSTFSGQYGNTYAFFSVATDNLGDRQTTPSQSQATTTVAPLITMTRVQDLLNKKKQVTEAIITFSGPVNASEVDSVATYRLATPGKKGSYTAKNATVIKLKSAMFNAATDQVILTPKKPFALTKPVQLLVHGQPPSGLQDSLGRLIDGNHDNQPGGDAIAILSKKAVTIDASVAPTRGAMLITGAAIDALFERGEMPTTAQEKSPNASKAPKLESV